MADTNAYSADPQFEKYYKEILAGMTPQTIDYKAPTVDEIAAQISSYLRPAVDRQIKARQQSTAQQRAATDVDAAARGILASTWVTDIKNRLKQSEAADIADAESDYRAQLLQGVYARQAQEADRVFQIEQFNAQMRQQAEKEAYDRAGDMYSIYLQGHSGGGGGGGGSSTAALTPEETAADEGLTYEEWLRRTQGLTQLIGKTAGKRPGSLLGQTPGLLSGRTLTGLRPTGRTPVVR